MIRGSWLSVLLLLQLRCSFADAATLAALPRPLRGSTFSNYDTILQPKYTPAVNPAFPGKQRRVARATGPPVHVESGLPVVPAWPFWEEDVTKAFAADSSGVLGVDVTDQSVGLEAKARRGDAQEHEHAKRTAPTAAARRRVQSQGTKAQQPPSPEQVRACATTTWGWAEGRCVGLGGSLLAPLKGSPTLPVGGCWGLDLGIPRPN